MNWMNMYIKNTRVTHWGLDQVGGTNSYENVLIDGILEKYSLRNSSSVYTSCLSEHLDYEYLLGSLLYNLFTWKM